MSCQIPNERDSNRDSNSQIMKSKLSKKQSFVRHLNCMPLSQSGLFQRPTNILKENQNQKGMSEKIYKLMADYIPKDQQTIQKSIVNHVQYTLARTRMDFKTFHCYQAVAHSIRDRLIQYFNDTYRSFYTKAKKRVYYFSLQFLIGRCLQNAVINLNIEQQYRNAILDLGYQWERLYDKEVDPGLGNGGLGRLAACFLDSLATLNYPSMGYGIRYQYGIFKQFIKDGFQIQQPDFWLSQGNPWEIQRFDVQYKIQFYGKTRKVVNNKGKQIVVWEDYQTIIARAYDTPIPGYATSNTISLRLWRSLPANQFDFNSFNSGGYFEALKQKQKAEYITSVLYPNDSTQQGKQLRLKQEYLLCSASLQDIIRRNKNAAKMQERQYSWQQFAQHSSVQLNDTHPALSIVQLLRILVDQQQMEHQKAWDIVYHTFSYTNHTVLPEALQKWSVQILGKLLPRHLQLIYLINYFWLNKVSKKYADNNSKLNDLSLVEESYPKKIRMANLSIIGSHTVNGVAYLHTQLLKKTLFKDFYEMYPDKFINITNGVTTRRWIVCCNPLLAQYYTQNLGTDQWILETSRLKELEKMILSDNKFCKWKAIKTQNKKRLADWVKRHCNVQIDVESMFDVQVKRIHEYKRQFMNILYVIWRYFWIKNMKPEERKNVVARTVMFAGKAAPGYDTAKKIIKLINEVSYVINNDEQTKHYLKCVFLPNYCVSNAQIIIPATQLSQHISTAGTEASGTSNMKFVMNGSLIIGTMDGANVEIYEQVGSENIFIFGARVQQIDKLKEKMQKTSPQQYIPDKLKLVFKSIREGIFGDRNVLSQLLDTICYNNDRYLICADFESYVKTQQQVDKAYKDEYKWNEMSVKNALRSGKFSSDRTIQEYVDKVWKLSPCKVSMSSFHRS